MGQIQNSISGLAEKVALAKTGAELLQPEREMKAVKAQDEANTYVNTEVKDAYIKSLDAERKLSEAEGKADMVFDKYGVMPERARDYVTITGWSFDESKLSKNASWKQRQLNSIRQSVYDLNTANTANTIAQNELAFKRGQYKAFRKRAEALSKKAKMNMPEALSKYAMGDKEMAWSDEYFKGGKR